MVEIRGRDCGFLSYDEEISNQKAAPRRLDNGLHSRLGLMTPPADLHFADAPLRTAFRSPQIVCVDPTPAGKRGGFCSPVASAFGR